MTVQAASMFEVCEHACLFQAESSCIAGTKHFSFKVISSLGEKASDASADATQQYIMQDYSEASRQRGYIYLVRQELKIAHDCLYNRAGHTIQTGLSGLPSFLGPLSTPKSLLKSQLYQATLQEDAIWTKITCS